MKISYRTCLQHQCLSLSHRFKSNFDSMQTLIDLLEFTPFVNFPRNDNSCCCLTKETKIESAHHEHRIYGSRPAGRDTANVESTDPGRNVLMSGVWHGSLYSTNLSGQPLQYQPFRATSTVPTFQGSLYSTNLSGQPAPIFQGSLYSTSLQGSLYSTNLSGQPLQYHSGQPLQYQSFRGDSTVPIFQSSLYSTNHSITGVTCQAVIPGLFALLLLLRSQLYLWGTPLWVRFLRMCPFFNPTIEGVTFLLHG